MMNEMIDEHRTKQHTPWTIHEYPVAGANAPRFVKIIRAAFAQCVAERFHVLVEMRD